jgi:hypothetical protein
MFNQNIYFIQPYKIGSKERKSTVITIPAKIVKKFEINTNTLFILKSESKRKLILHKISNIDDKIDFENKTMIPAAKSFQASIQQASGEVH